VKIILLPSIVKEGKYSNASELIFGPMFFGAKT
jgi:hypothetical protein